MSAEIEACTLPAGWKRSSIMDVASGGLFIDGDWVESKDQDPTGEVRLTQLADVGEGEFRHRSDRWMRENQARRLGVTYLQEGDLLIARMPAPLGRCCQVPIMDAPSVTVVDVAVLRIQNQRFEPRYVMWMLNCPQVRVAMESVASGTTRVRISRKNLGTIQIPAPERAEQEKIVEILEEQLSRLDAALTSVRTVRDMAAKFRRSILHTAFTGALTGHDTSSGDLPNGWEAQPLSGIVRLKSGYAYKSRDWLDSGVPVIKIANVRSGCVNLDGCSFVSETIANETDEFAVVKGDLLITLTGEIGATGVYSYDEPARVNQRVARIDIRDRDTCLFDYLHLFLQSPRVRQTLWDAAQGMAQPNVSPKEVAAMEMLVPPLAEQEKVVEILEEQLSRLDASLAATDAVEKRASALRRSLLHAAFTGKLTEQWREGSHV